LDRIDRFSPLPFFLILVVVLSVKFLSSYRSWDSEDIPQQIMQAA